MKTVIPCLLLFVTNLVNGCASSRQVIVYSFLTDTGRGLPVPNPEIPTRYALASGGYHEWGGVRAGEKPATLADVEPLVRAGLLMNGYRGLRQGESPELVVMFHWGCLRPEARGLPSRHFDAVVNQDDMLDLVGVRALAANPDRILQSALIEAAAEERYFLIVSGYLPPRSGEGLTRLLWRTQCSLPLASVDQKQAFPILAAVGAIHFGREASPPDFVTIDVEQVLRDAIRHEIP